MAMQHCLRICARTTPKFHTTLEGQEVFTVTVHVYLQHTCPALRHADFSCLSNQIHDCLVSLTLLYFPLWRSTTQGGDEDQMTSRSSIYIISCTWQEESFSFLEAAFCFCCEKCQKRILSMNAQTISEGCSTQNYFEFGGFWVW